MERLSVVVVDSLGNPILKMDCPSEWAQVTPLSFFVSRIGAWVEGAKPVPFQLRFEVDQHTLIVQGRIGKDAEDGALQLLDCALTSI